MSAPIWFDSTETGAPTLNNAAGSLITLLRAVLINGFNVKSISSISVASGVATVTCPAHGYSSAYGKRLKISGASAPALNGVKQQTIVDANTFTFPVPGVADGSYTATDARRAPLGWTEVFVNGGATVAIYARSAPEAAAQLLRVNDSHANGSTATDARVLSVESATGVDAYTAESPTTAQLSGGFFWSKGPNTAAAKEWVVCGDDINLYLMLPTSNAAGGQFAYFCDLASYFPGDAYRTVIAGSSAAVSGGATVSTRAFALQGMQTPLFSANNPTVQRSRSFAGTAQFVAPIGPQTTEGGSNGTADFVQVPILKPVPVLENDSVASHPVRGHLPGLAAPLANKPFTHRQVVIAGSKAFLSLRTLGAGLFGNALLDLDALD